MKNLPDRVRRLAALISDPFTLCEFTGKAESEHLIAEMIGSCRLNMDEGRGCFSFRGENLPWNEHYKKLLRDGLIVERSYEGRATIAPTELLLSRLEGHFGVGASDQALIDAEVA